MRQPQLQPQPHSNSINIGGSSWSPYMYNQFESKLGTIETKKWNQQEQLYAYVQEQSSSKTAHSSQEPPVVFDWKHLSWWGSQLAAYVL